MKLSIQSPKRALNKAFLKQRALRSEIDLFKANLIRLLGRVDEIEREENQKNHVRDFLRDTFYNQLYEINTKDSKDLVIHVGKTNKDKVGVIIEAKRPGNKAEMMSAAKPNAKALQELVLYFLRERIEENNNDIKYCIATNIYEWFIFDAKYFEKLFFEDKTFVKEYKNWRDGKKVTKDTNLFYTEIAKPFIDSLKIEIPCTYFDIRDYEKILRNPVKEDDKNLIALLKILSPNHLLRVPFADDSNKLDENFYRELLYIIGLEEAKEGSKYIIRRKKENRNEATLIEQAITELNTVGFHKIVGLENYGETNTERSFNISLELCITWINRVLFLKLLEGQLINYHKGDKDFRFLNIQMINDFDELYTLFHKVLTVKQEERTDAIKKKYFLIPYLNSSLFEISELEEQTIKINSLNSSLKTELISSTVLKEQKSKSDKLPTLDYLFKFLSAYDFSSEGKEDIQEDVSKKMINASVLGKVFEKINGYKDGSIFTPGFITMYMCRQTIRLAVMQKFKDKYGWKLKQFDDLKNYLADKKTSKDILNQNKVINSLHLCDPAVGSGHFLVSSLNEIIAIKSELGLLADDAGIRFTEYDVTIENDELIVTNSNGDIFEYKIQNNKPQSKEAQRLQKTLFHEKQTLIENCLFGVDINPNSVKICRLRLWIELLKNAYYKEEDYKELETLPNIDINIKCGNSLLSRFAVTDDLKAAFKKQQFNLATYKAAVDTYRNSTNGKQKRELLDLITKIKSEYTKEIGNKDPRRKKISDLKGKIIAAKYNLDLFGKKMSDEDAEIEVKRLTMALEKAVKELEETESGKIYYNSFEWRFEFPEVLNDNGDFEGFDVVIGNPPYIKEYEHRAAFDGLRNKVCYQGKMDIWYLFGELGLLLLKPESYLCYIATNNWVTNAGASKFRNHIIQNSKILNLTDFGAYMIFDNASIQTMIMLFKKDNDKDNYTFDYRRLQGKKPILENVLNLLEGIKTDNSVLLSPKISKEVLLDSTLTFNTDKNSSLLEKIKSKQNFNLREKADKELGLKSELGQGIVAPQDFVNNASATLLNNQVKIGDGIFVLSKSEFEDKKFLEVEKEIIKPYFTTDQIHKYFAINQNTHWIIYTKSDINKPDKKTKHIPLDDYPNIKDHFDKFKSVITSDFGPYGLHRAREQHFFEGEKVIALRKCPVEPIFTYVDFDSYVSQTFFVIQSERINLKYLTGLLNSKLIAFWLRRKGKMQGNNYQLDKEPLLAIPIYKPSEKEMSEIANLVNQIIQQKEKGNDTKTLETEIDKLVCRLYEITPEEQKIIES